MLRALNAEYACNDTRRFSRKGTGILFCVCVFIYKGLANISTATSSVVIITPVINKMYLYVEYSQKPRHNNVTYAIRFKCTSLQPNKTVCWHAT